ncbi:MAG: hypothetical protein JKX97_02740 [Candidatus Lindowbacteria bacterium]|nr:hypothetical protein [Candidatus Lindowbacteria bacterium]
MIDITLYLILVLAQSSPPSNIPDHGRLPVTEGTIEITFWHVGEIPSFFGTDTAQKHLTSWLKTVFPRRNAIFRGHRTINSPSYSPSEKSTELLRDNILAMTPQGASNKISVIYVPSYDNAPMGRAWYVGNGLGVIIMNSKRIMRNSGAKGAIAREHWLLNHETIHALGFVPSANHLIKVRGNHCSQPNCVLYGKVRLIDIFAFFFPGSFAEKQPANLEKLCSKDIASLRKKARE